MFKTRKHVSLVICDAFPRSGRNYRRPAPALDLLLEDELLLESSASAPALELLLEERAVAQGSTAPAALQRSSLLLEEKVQLEGGACATALELLLDQCSGI